MMTILKSNLNLELVGRGQATIRPSNYIATGGEGSVYRLNDTIVKLFTDPDTADADFPQKLKALSRLTYDGIVSPLGLATKNGKVLGYYMQFIEAEPLSRMFTNDFILRHGITRDTTCDVVKKMRDIVSYAHSMKAILVDANELNWLVQLQGSPKPYVIDVDSWSIDRFKGSVIMPSIRDYHARVFDEKSDWFAWGIVTFQLFTGIHPYKGVLPGYDRGDLEARMKANASVFSKGIRLNHAVRDLSLIPGGLRSWYEAVFQKGERTTPPSNFEDGTKTGTIGHVVRQVVTAQGGLRYDKLLDGPHDILNIFPSGFALLSNGDLVELSSQKSIATFGDRHAEVVETSVGLVGGEMVRDKGKLYSLSRQGAKQEISLPFAIEKFVRYNNRLFAITEKGLTEIAFHRFSKVIASSKATWNALPYGTKWYDGFGVQNALSAVYFIFPFGEDGCVHMRAKELDGLSILSGVRGDRTLTIMALRGNGKLTRFDFVLSKDGSSYSVTTSDTDTSDSIEVTLPKGVTIAIVDDGKLGVSIPGGDKVKIIEDKDIFMDTKLYREGNVVLYVRKGVIWRLSMT